MGDVNVSDNVRLFMDVYSFYLDDIIIPPVRNTC